MKWVTHQAGALAAAVWFQADVVLTAAMVCGAVLPDAAEQAISRGNRTIFFKIHRGILHWFGLYLAVLVGVWFVPFESMPFGEAGRVFIGGLALGALSHLVLDGLNPTGVPLLPFKNKPRFKANLFSTGSFGEWCFLGALLILIIYSGQRLNASWLDRFFNFF